MTARPLLTPEQAERQGIFDGECFADRFVTEAAGHDLKPGAQDEFVRIFTGHLRECCVILKDAGTSEAMLAVYARACAAAVTPRLKIHQAMGGASEPLNTRS